MTDNEYLQMWDLFQRRKENFYTLKFANALRQQLEQFKKYRDAAYITATPIYNVLYDLYTTVGPQWAHKSQLHLRREKARLPMGFSERIVELMRQYYGIDLLNDAELMTAVTREQIVKILSEAAQTGLSFDEIVRELIKSPAFTKIRARRIARTETVTAANGAAMINAQESGKKYNKKWLAINDKRTRPDHRDISGHQTDLDGYFTVGGATMQHPGDRDQENGLPVPAKEVVNCRCTMLLIPKRGERGELIF